MSRLEDLLQTLCPNGVECVDLGDYASVNKGEQLNLTRMTDDAPYPVFNGGIKPSGNFEEFNTEANTIAISQGGASAGYVNFVETKFWAGAHCYVVKPKKTTVDNKFLYYFIKNSETEIQNAKYGAGIPGLNKSTLERLKLPLPPLPVQEEIVRILDTFSSVVTELEQKLEAEQAARVRQYEHYRNELLSFDTRSMLAMKLLDNYGSVKVEYKTLRDISNIFIGSFIKSTEHDASYQYPVYNGGIKPTGYYSKSNSEKNCIAISARGANCGFVNYLTVDFWAGNSCYVLKSLNETVSPKFLFYFLKANQEKLYTLRQKSGIPAINSEPLGKFEVPILPLSVQEQIVSILDRFDALVNDLKSGLPAEIALRRKQYEYYRDKLLTFQPLN